VVSPATTFVCDGKIRIADRTFRCLGHHGRIDFQTAIEKSCNVFFAEVARRLKREDIVAVAKEFGLGTPTGIDIPSETSGLLPTDAWFAKANRKWYVGDTVNLGIGQGYLLCSPLQMATYVSILANRGFGFKPYLLQSISDSDAPTRSLFTKPELAYKVNLDPIWWDRIVTAMVSVVNSGSGTLAHINGVSFAGKTGSADTVPNERSHAWFIGFAPAENPRIALAVVLEGAGRGGQEAAPVAKAIVSQYLRRLSPR
jgi:penicillin-binding protein 2